MRVLLPLLFLSLLLLPMPAAADCSGGATPTGKPCGAVPFQGCCKGGDLYFCEGGQLCMLSCDKLPHCGWNPDLSFYDCQTDGMADPSLAFSKECPVLASGACQGVAYDGCCAGSSVYWCDGKSLHAIDCADNATRTACGGDPVHGVANCVAPGGPEYKSCPFAEGEVVVTTDIVTSGETTGGDAGSVAEVQWSTEGLVVPDINAPSSCGELADRYAVASTDCGIFADGFLVKQDGCAALLVGLVPSGESHPVAKVTKSGMAFDFLDAGLQRQCTGQLGEGTVTGQCFWGDDASCQFTFTAVAKAPAEEEPEKPKSGGGCQASRQPGGAALWLLLVLGALWWRRRGVRMG